VNEQARQILADILLFDVSDPRLREVTITGCEVSFDRSYCNVFYTTKPESYEKTADAFDRAKGRIRSLMAKKQSWRVTPELRFILDETIDRAERIDWALKADAARNAGAADAQGEGDAPAADGLVASDETE
jgi:ribosome-binding factor A